MTTERYVYDGSNIDLVFDGAGVQTHRYLYGTGVDQVLADERGGTVVWALSDHQGTVRDIVAGNGTILNHVVYDSFGKVQSQSDATVAFRYGYTGREKDSETGLDYYRARYYDASNGRFISEDPIGFSAGDNNLYRYVGNSPVNAIDPSGLVTEIYIHEGHTLYGHTAININGTVYTFGRYQGTTPKPRTGGAIGEGLFYKVDKDYYLNSEKFTPKEDTVTRFRIELSPEEEKAIEEKYRNIYNNQTKKGKPEYILGKNRARGRILKDDYNLITNNCTTIIIGFLPKRAANEIATQAARGYDVLGTISPANLKYLLSKYNYPNDLGEAIFGVKRNLKVTQESTVQPGIRRY